MQLCTWDNDELDTNGEGMETDGEMNGENNGDDTVDWEDFDASIRSDCDAWRELTDAHRD